MIHTAFLYIPVNFAFNLPHYVITYIHHTGKKGSENSFLKKKTNKVAKSFLQGDSNLDPQNQLELKVNTSIHWTTSVNADV